LFRQLPFKIEHADHIFYDLASMRNSLAGQVFYQPFQALAEIGDSPKNSLGGRWIDFEYATNAYRKGLWVRSAAIGHLLYEAGGLKDPRESQGSVGNAMLCHDGWRGYFSAEYAG